MIKWYVYMVRCAKGALYTGIALDVQKRVQQHNSGMGARSIKALGRPVSLVYVEEAADKSTALKRECAIKKLKRTDKIRLIGDPQNVVRNYL